MIIMPLALQPAVGFGLSNKILPFFSICHQFSPSSLNASSFFLFSTFVTISFFYCVGLLAPRQTQTWRTRVYLFVRVIILDLSSMGGPTSSIRYRQHSSWDHVTTQAPPLRQIRDNFGEVTELIFSTSRVWNISHSKNNWERYGKKVNWFSYKPLNAELNPICHLLALLGAHHILHVSTIRVKDAVILVRF
jgi:hypothetical protein